MSREIEDLKSRLNTDTPELPWSVEIDEPVADPLQFLASMSLYPKFLFSYRDQNRIVAGCGTALRFKDTTEVLRALTASGDSAPPCFAAIPFSPNTELIKPWRAFDDCQLIVPSVIAEISENRERVTAIVPVTGDTTKEIAKAAADELQEIVGTAFKRKELPQLPKVKSRIDIPDDTGFKRLVETALTAIQRGELNKVVAARQTDLEFESKLDPISLFATLRNSVSADVYSFLLQPDDEHAFIGFSPERLFKIEDSLITTEAVAGTSPSDSAYTLLTSEKDMHEHQVVVDFLTATLAETCDNVEVDKELSLKCAGSISHLYKKATAHLQESRSTPEVLSALHPTPAVCGTPRDRAFRFIRDNEPFDRGFYAGAIGLIGGDHTELSVAVRSFLIHRNVISFFAGAGIVDGSNPKSELREIESKIATYLRVVGIE